MWAEQMPPLLQAGFRILRLDMRGHGGSDPVAGDYTMAALVGDVASALGMLGIARIHYLGLSIGGMIGQALAIAHGDPPIPAVWCAPPRGGPRGGAVHGAQRMSTAGKANSLKPPGDPTMERWFTDAFKPQKPARWKQIRDTIAATTPAGYLGCSTAIMDYDFL